MFTELPFLDRFAAAQAAGFKAVEFQFPYQFRPEDIAARVNGLGLKVVLFNLPPGDFAAGERGIACHPGRRREFAGGITRAMHYASLLDCRTINCLAGVRPAAVPREQSLAELQHNLSVAAAALAESNIQLVIEPINTHDMPGFLLNHSADAVAVMDNLKPHDVKLQYDVYHMQRMEGELLNTLTRLLPRIGHVQIADTPGRHEPGTGEINFRSVFRHLDTIGYDGWVGCEYTPVASTVAGLGWRDLLEGNHA